MSGLDFPATALGSTGGRELQGNRVRALGTEFDINVLASILSTDGGDVLGVSRSNLEGVRATSTRSFLGVTGSSDCERVKVQTKSADAVGAFVDGVFQSGSRGVSRRVIGILDVGAILGDGRAAGGDGEHAAGTESRSASASGSSTLAGALGRSVTGTVAVLRTATVRGCTCASIILELDNVEERKSFGFSLWFGCDYRTEKKRRNGGY